MAGLRLFNIHRPWEDWLGMLLGLVVGLSPWLADEQGSQIVNWNAVIVGGLILALAAMELSGLQRWEESAEAAVGFWLIASPFLFGYAGDGALWLWHVILGAIVVVLAALELWQDWKLSDEQLAHHGN